MTHFLSEKAKNLTPYVAGLQPQESGWIKLNTNENPYPPSPRVIAALRGADAEKLRLYPDGDSGALRTAIAKTLGVDAENIFCANSSDEVLALAFTAFFAGKENVLSPDISYGFYPVWAEINDVKMRFLPVRDSFEIDIADYKNSAGVVIANPNAPTGLALEFSQIEEIARENPCGVVLIDEAYMDFARVKSAAELVKKYENLLVVRTFSKSHSLAGMRVGYAIGQPHLIDGLRRARDAFNSYPLDMLAQNCAAAAISDTEYLQKTVEKIITTRDRTIARIRGLGFEVPDSHANFIFMRAENARGLYERLLSQKILVRHWNKPKISDCLRVSIGTDEEMDAFVRCLEKGAK